MIIGMVGKAGSGKDTVGEYLVRKYGYTRFALADEEKRIAVEEFGWDGVKDKRGRRLLQLIGTECGREYNPNIWIQKLDENIFGNGYEFSVVTDIRFQNEADWIKSVGGILIRVVGRGGLQSNTGGNHASEIEQESIKVDYTIDNGKTYDDLYGKIDTVMSMVT